MASNEPLSVEALNQIPLRYGSHVTRAAGVCAMEAVAWLAGEPHSDRPKCACPVLTAMVVSLNDRLKSDEEREILLKPLLPKLLNTRVSREVERRRAYVATNWAIRENLPRYLELVEKLKPLAQRLREMPEIVDTYSARAARIVVVEAARDAAYVKRAAAYATAAADAAVDAAVYADGYADAYATAIADAYAAADADAYATATAAAYADAERRLSAFRWERIESVVALIERLIEIREAA